LATTSPSRNGSAPEDLPDRHIRRLAFRQLLEKCARDPNGIDVNAYEIPEDMHLLRSPASFIDEVSEILLTAQHCTGDRMPAVKTHEILRFRPHEVTVWFGYKASYKSVFLSELFTYWASLGKVVCIASFEMPAKKLVALACRQALVKENPTWDEVFHALHKLSNGLVVYDVMGRVAPKHLHAVMNYCAQELGCEHFLVDNLTDLLPVGNDHSDQHQRFTAGCLTIARATGMHVHLVAHCAKPERGDVSKPPTGYSIRGTGAVPDMVENLIGVWRNIPKEDELARDDISAERREEFRRQADVVLLVDKQKFWDYRGAINFWIDRRYLRFREGGYSECDPFV
jgi:twinkle protein